MPATRLTAAVGLLLLALVPPAASSAQPSSAPPPAVPPALAGGWEGVARTQRWPAFLTLWLRPGTDSALLVVRGRAASARRSSASACSPRSTACR